MCVPTQSTRFVFIGEKLVLEKLASPFILFYFKRENKIRKKTLKSDSIFLEKCVFEKYESRSGDQVTYWEGTSKR